MGITEDREQHLPQSSLLGAVAPFGLGLRWGRLTQVVRKADSAVARDLGPPGQPLNYPVFSALLDLSFSI